MDSSSLNATLQNIITSFHSLTRTVEERIDVLKQAEDRYEISQKKVGSLIARAEEQINLNVGGLRVSTSRSILTSIGGTFFFAMLSSDEWKRNDQGEYFIDRDPKHFSRIMSYLRSKELKLEGLSKIATKEFYDELEYYQIPTPSQLAASSTSPLEWDTQSKGEKILLSNQNRSARKMEDTRSNQIVVGTRAVLSFKVKLSMRVNGRVLVGMAPKSEKLDLNNGNSTKCGWYLWLYDGCLYSQDGDQFGRKYARPVAENKIVQVHYNEINGTISFTIDGKDHGVAFSNIPPTILYPCVELSECGDVIETVD
eukprot:TRINITY_DN2990_c0_g1_i1.p1 TRINITY_DN2990_c0_g1~~TRINITY_DN2990_c0_g1_i1.p1  ORF type:complete len:311 (-),score=61.58 TRINITY_DN2990_c0_g1_i1:29-961(-)